jgi:hypothetical protein
MRALAGLLVVLAPAGCKTSASSPDAAPTGSAIAVTPPPPPAEPAPDASDDAVSTSASPCPGDMVYVDTSFCPDVERRCTDIEHEKINHLDICHAFAHEQRCRTAERRVAFCIDRFEYPNRQGAHPVWMVDWYQAQATCEARGKRLCWGGEWTAACEGPEHTPFPYGWERDHTKCNMDNFYIEPRKPGERAQFDFYSKDPQVALKELSRLDQSVPSGSMESCQSGFGVFDMPGNFDEWVVSDQPPQEKSRWAGLKGGAWGHVRSQCRPMTFSHEPQFAYYFVGFRCCRDADGAPAEARWAPSPHAIPAPAVEPRDFAPDPIVPVDPSGPSKTKYSRTGHRE